MFHLPESASYTEKVKLYWATGASNAWQVWNKPSGMKMLHIIAISGGGGGAGAQHNGNGGGGGGSSGISVYLYPAWAIPDALLIQVGPAGTGGAAEVNGVAGNLSYVSLYPNTAANNLFAVSGAAAPGAGLTAGGGGAAGTIATDAGAVFSCWALATHYIAGVAGTAGGAAGVAGTNLAVGTGCMILSGTGGGGSGTKAGGDISAVSSTPFIVLPGGAAGQNPGNPGFRFGQFPILYGGTGAGSLDGGTGGDAQRGGCGVTPGTGGGGGGETGSPPPTVGTGGDGGGGLVIMATW